jgi:hypothetical protein
MLTNEDRAIYGDEARRHGDPDYRVNDVDSSAVDTIANVLHDVVSTGGDADSIVRQALVHLRAELAGE